MAVVNGEGLDWIYRVKDRWIESSLGGDSSVEILLGMVSAGYLNLVAHLQK